MPRSFETIKKDMVELIQANLPLEFERTEADSFYGIEVSKSGKITGTGYAEGIRKHLKDLPMEDLAGLLTSKFGSWKSFDLTYETIPCVQGCRECYLYGVDCMGKKKTCKEFKKR